MRRTATRPELLAHLSFPVSWSAILITRQPRSHHRLLNGLRTLGHPVACRSRYTHTTEATASFRAAQHLKTSQRALLTNVSSSSYQPGSSLSDSNSGSISTSPSSNASFSGVTPLNVHSFLQPSHQSSLSVGSYPASSQVFAQPSQYSQSYGPLSDVRTRMSSM